MTKTLGIIGGMGPLATARLYELVTLHDRVERDQEHFNVIIISIPSTPDRTAFILGKSSNSPIPSIAHAASKLAALGANYLAMPCITSHCLLGDLKFERPLISMPDETLIRIKADGCRSFGLLATEGTIATGLFSKLAQHYGLKLILPDSQAQARVTDVIYSQVKRGDLSGGAAIREVADGLLKRGADVCVLGCTELSLLNLTGRFADPLDITARRAVKLCGGKVAENAVLV
ncbi:MAG: amino acid racemase [Clostridiales bacterium]|nr:amino acid racemase [Clostridiales bacterium]MDR2751059.1 amino acid racemase [Clostridiales bacterium]